MTTSRLAALAVIGVALAPGPATRRSRPDLVVRAVDQAPVVVAPGARLRITDVVRNTGTKEARASRTRYALVTSEATERLRGGRTVPALLPGAHSRSATLVTVPAAVAPGIYRLLACADARRRVNEADERNNCRRSRARVRVDPAAPGAPVVAEGPPDPTAATVARFGFAAPDPDARLECGVDDGEPAPCTSPLELAALADGEHRLTIVATDAAGNRSEPTSYDWTVDTTAPAAPVLTEHPDALSARTDARLRFAAEDGASLLCRLDAGPRTSCTSPQAYGPLADGAHTFAVVARDTAGNESAAREYTWSVDATAPPAPRIDEHPDAETTAASARFSFSDDEAGVRLSCRLDGATFRPCTSPERYDDLEDGAHTFTVAARDAAGNRSATAFQWTIVLRPAAATGPPGTLSPTSAGLTGTVDPRGSETTYWFEYGPTAAYGARSGSASAGSGSGELAVGLNVTGLNPLTTYHYRLVASTCGGCAAGTARGADVTFTTLPANTYQNPVYGGIPDPMALLGAAEYYTYGTGSLFPILRSTDMVHWTRIGTALQARPSWVPQTGEYNPWAPSVLETAGPCPGTDSTSCFHMYYTGLNAAVSPPANCIGVAIATRPAGPFRDLGILDTDPPSTDGAGRPIGCGDDAGYSNIDPAPFVDPVSGQAYLYLSTGHEPSREWRRTISVIPLSADLTHAAGPRIALFRASQAWEREVVEGPWLERHGAGYYLFYSGGVFSNETYAMSYALGASPSGPFAKTTAEPILRGTADVIGPGGGSVVVGPRGGDWMIYHGRAYPGGPRTLRIDPLAWDDSTSQATVTVDGPTTSPRPLP